MEKENILVGRLVTNRAIEPKSRLVVSVSDNGFDVVCVKKDGNPIKGAKPRTVPWAAAPFWKTV